MATGEDRSLEHLEHLVRCDTRNPPRAVRESGIFDYLASVLAPCGVQCELVEHGDGCTTLFGTRGTPQLLFNFHVDTVPDGSRWSGDPHVLRREGERAIGLGACDVKGAAAAMLAAIQISDGDVAVLFTSDEEAGNSRCVRRFLERRLPFRGAIVAEPTCGRAVVAHRGVIAVQGIFTGRPMHSSAPEALTESAVHRAIQWAGNALRLASDEEEREIGTLSGIRLNIGRFEGGTNFNIAAAEAKVSISARPRPLEDPAALLQRIQACAPESRGVSWSRAFIGPPLPGPRVDPTRAREIASALRLPTGEAVDFWSEAALFSAAGYPAIVFGPGDIAQAHTQDEWISIAALAEAEATYRRLLSDGA